MFYYPTIQDVLDTHAFQIEKYGGAYGIRDEGAILAALARPQNGYYEGLIEEATALFESLAINHPFVDGNKRTAFAVTDGFLRINGGYKIDVKPNDAYGFLMSLFETNRFKFQPLKEWLASVVVEIEKPKKTEKENPFKLANLDSYWTDFENKRLESKISYFSKKGLRNEVRNLLENEYGFIPEIDYLTRFEYEEIQWIFQEGGEVAVFDFYLPEYHIAIDVYEDDYFDSILELDILDAEEIWKNMREEYFLKQQYARNNAHDLTLIPIDENLGMSPTLYLRSFLYYVGVRPKKI